MYHFSKCCTYIILTVTSYISSLFWFCLMIFHWAVSLGITKQVIYISYCSFCLKLLVNYLVYRLTKTIYNGNTDFFFCLFVCFCRVIVLGLTNNTNFPFYHFKYLNVLLLYHWIFFKQIKGMGFSIYCDFSASGVCCISTAMQYYKCWTFDKWHK